MSHLKAFLWYIAKVQNNYHDYITRIATAVKVTNCKSLTPNVMNQVSQFVSNSQLCHKVTKLLSISIAVSVVIVVIVNQKVSEWVSDKVTYWAVLDS